MPFFGIQTSKEGLLLRLQGLVEAAAKGQLLDPKQKDPKQKVTTEDPQPCQPSLSESWTTVSRKKKQQPPRTSKGEGKGVSGQGLNCERTIGLAIESFEPRLNLDICWTKKGAKNLSFF